MTAEIFFRYVHFISLFIAVSALVTEYLLLKPQLIRQELQRIYRVDSIYGLSAVLFVAAGMMLWFVVGKPAEFYSKNWIFYVKIILAVTAGLLSIIPTIFFFKERKGDPNELVNAPAKLKWYIRLQLLIMFIVPLLATLMAKGVGSF